MSKRSNTHTDSPEKLVASLRELLAEAEGIASQGGEVAASKFDDIREKFGEYQEKIQDAYAYTRDKVVAGAKTADKTIRSHPYESLAVALGVGVLLGALIRRRD